MEIIISSLWEWSPNSFDFQEWAHFQGAEEVLSLFGSSSSSPAPFRQVSHRFIHSFIFCHSNLVWSIYSRLANFHWRCSHFCSLFFSRSNNFHFDCHLSPNSAAFFVSIPTTFLAFSDFPNFYCARQWTVNCKLSFILIKNIHRP